MKNIHRLLVIALSLMVVTSVVRAEEVHSPSGKSTNTLKQTAAGSGRRLQSMVESDMYSLLNLTEKGPAQMLWSLDF